MCGYYMIPGIPSSSSYNQLAWLLAHSYIPSLMAPHPLKAVITRLGSMMPRSDVAPKAAVADFPFPYYSKKGIISRKETDKPQQMKIQFEFQMNDCEPCYLNMVLQAPISPSWLASFATQEAAQSSKSWVDDRSEEVVETKAERARRPRPRAGWKSTEISLRFYPVVI